MVRWSSTFMEWGGSQFFLSLAATFLWCTFTHRDCMDVYTCFLFWYCCICFLILMQFIMHSSASVNRIPLNDFAGYILRHFITTYPVHWKICSSLRIIHRLWYSSQIMAEMTIHCRLCYRAYFRFQVIVWNVCVIAIMFFFCFYTSHKSYCVCIAHILPGHLLLSLYAFEGAVRYCHVP